MNLHSKILKVMKDAGVVGKDGQVAYGKTRYNYFKAEDVMSKIRPHLAANGLSIYREAVLSLDMKEFKTAQGALNHLVTVVCKYAIVDTEKEGSMIYVQSVGQGADSADKASNKALTSAYKYMLFDLFKVVDQADDPDVYASDSFHDIEVDTPSAPPPEKQKVDPKSAASKLKADRVAQKISDTKDVVSEFKAYIKDKGVTKKEEVKELCDLLKLQNLKDTQGIGKVLQDKEALDTAIYATLKVGDDEIPF